MQDQTIPRSPPSPRPPPVLPFPSGQQQSSALSSFTPSLPFCQPHLPNSAQHIHTAPVRKSRLSKPHSTVLGTPLHSFLARPHLTSSAYARPLSPSLSPLLFSLCGLPNRLATVSTTRQHGFIDEESGSPRHRGHHPRSLHLCTEEGKPVGRHWRERCLCPAALPWTGQQGEAGVRDRACLGPSTPQIPSWLKGQTRQAKSLHND